MRSVLPPFELIRGRPAPTLDFQSDEALASVMITRI